MAKRLISRHAEDVGGGLVVEPGQEIPEGADEAIVKRLTDERLTVGEAEPKQEPTQEGGA